MAPVVLLSGGTGGAKLARGLQDAVGDDLVVIANTGDDLEIYGGYVAPDPDLVTFWLADRIDERGWGLRDDTFVVMDAMRELGDDIWFNLGDRDLAICLRRAQRLREGARLTEAIDETCRAFGVRARVLPMSDDAVRTRVRSGGRWHGFQQFMIREGAEGPVEDVGFDGVDAARPAPEALDAIAAAGAIVIGPSNPVISIGPILAVRGMREALLASPASVVAVSPLVRGAVLKGPTDQFMAWAGHPLSSDGIVAHYDGLLDGLIADERAAGVPTLETDVEMGDGPHARASRPRRSRSPQRWVMGLSKKPPRARGQFSETVISHGAATAGRIRDRPVKRPPGSASALRSAPIASAAACSACAWAVAGPAACPPAASARLVSR